MTAVVSDFFGRPAEAWPSALTRALATSPLRRPPALATRPSLGAEVLTPLRAVDTPEPNFLVSFEVSTMGLGSDRQSSAPM